MYHHIVKFQVLGKYFRLEIFTCCPLQYKLSRLYRVRGRPQSTEIVHLILM